MTVANGAPYRKPQDEADRVSVVQIWLRSEHGLATDAEMYLRGIDVYLRRLDPSLLQC